MKMRFKSELLALAVWHLNNVGENPEISLGTNLIFSPLRSLEKLIQIQL